jgi:putative peptidoglycan lipid II flippase
VPSTVLIGTLAVLGLAAAFAQNVVLLTTLGAGAATDVYFASLILPQVLFAVATNASGAVVVPVLATAAQDEYRKAAWSVLRYALLGGLLLGPLCWVAVELAGPLVLAGFPPQRPEWARTVFAWQAAVVVPALLTIAGTGIVQARKHYAHAQFADTGGAVVGLIAMMLALPAIGILAAPLAQTVRYLTQLSLLVWRVGPYSSSPSAVAAEIRRRARGVLGATAVLKLDTALDRGLAATTGVGGLSLLNICQQIYSAAAQVATRAEVLPLTPALAAAASARDVPGTKRIVRRASIRIAIGLLLAGALLVFFGDRALTIVLARGRFSPDDADRIWLLMLALFGVGAGVVLGQLMATSLYARGDTRLAMRIGLAGFAVAVPLKIFACREYGLMGLAIAASAYYLGNCATLATALRRALDRR